MFTEYIWNLKILKTIIFRNIYFPYALLLLNSSTLQLFNFLILVTIARNSNNSLKLQLLKSSLLIASFINWLRCLLVVDKAFFPYIRISWCGSVMCACCARAGWKAFSMDHKWHSMPGRRGKVKQKGDEKVISL